MSSRLLKNTVDDALARQNLAKRGRSSAINDRYEPMINAARTNELVFQQPVGGMMPLYCLFW